MGRFVFIVVFLTTYALQAETLLVDSRNVFSGKYAYIIQTEKDSIALTNPSSAINTNYYSGLKNGLWINVAGYGDSIQDFEKYKRTFPKGYIKNLGQFCNTVHNNDITVPKIAAEWIVVKDNKILTDTQFVHDGVLFHLVYTRNMKGVPLFADTFSISVESQVTTINVSLFSSRTYPLVLERSYNSPLTGSSYEIRAFKKIGSKWCLKETFTNDGGPKDPIYNLHFTSDSDQPVVQEKINGKIVSRKSLTCK